MAGGKQSPLAPRRSDKRSRMNQEQNGKNSILPVPLSFCECNQRAPYWPATIRARLQRGSETEAAEEIALEPSCVGWIPDGGSAWRQIRGTCPLGGAYPGSRSPGVNKSLLLRAAWQRMVNNRLIERLSPLRGSIDPRLARVRRMAAKPAQNSGGERCARIAASGSRASLFTLAAINYADRVGLSVAREFGLDKATMRNSTEVAARGRFSFGGSISKCEFMVFVAR
jgi:hypothetical protein